MLLPTMRRIASVVFASAVLAGGLAVGSGTAAAKLDPHFPSVFKTFENIGVSKSVPQYGDTPTATAYVSPGQEIIITNAFQIAEGPERFLTRITDHGPVGFEYVPGSARVAISGVYTPGIAESVPFTPQVGSGTVSVTAPGSGWSVAPGDPEVWANDPGAPETREGGGSIVYFSVRYRAPQSAPYGAVFDTGVTFDVDGHEGGEGWNPMGLRVIIGTAPGASGSGSLDAFGSSGWAVPIG